jgi:hypothetical protein
LERNFDVSDNQTGEDIALDTLRRRIAELDNDAASHRASADLATRCADELRAVAATLTRKVKPRRPRVVETATAPEGGEPAAEAAAPVTFNGIGEVA